MASSSRAATTIAAAAALASTSGPSTPSPEPRLPTPDGNDRHYFPSPPPSRERLGPRGAVVGNSSNMGSISNVSNVSSSNSSSMSNDYGSNLRAPSSSSSNNGRLGYNNSNNNVSSPLRASRSQDLLRVGSASSLTGAVARARYPRAGGGGNANGATASSGSSQNLAVTSGPTARSRSRRRRAGGGGDGSRAGSVASTPGERTAAGGAGEGARGAGGGGGGGGKWKKLLWIKQPYPDNYTDASTFLLQLRRPPVRAYDFWPLVADSTAIVQHVCAVALFVCCFAGIYQERVGPAAVAGPATACTFAGWLLWDIWLGRDERDELSREREREKERAQQHQHHEKSTSVNSTAAASGGLENDGGGLGAVAKANGHGFVSSGTPDGGELNVTNGNNVSGANGSISTPGGVGMSGLGIISGTNSSAITTGVSVASNKIGSRSQSSTSLAAYYAATPPTMTGGTSNSAIVAPIAPTSFSSSSLPSYYPPYQAPNSLLSSRNQQRLATAKSALLIYLALLGLSPILKSLTLSTTSDSIWAMSCWLLLTNIFTFDYGGSSSSPSSTSSTSSSSSSSSSSSTSPTNNSNSENGNGNSSGGGIASPSPSPSSSLSTNAALMASTVLASRLPSTAHVFSLTLFSIEVFGLFPVFRRHLRQRSFALHVVLTALLILASGAGLGITLIGSGDSHGNNGNVSVNANVNVINGVVDPGPAGSGLANPGAGATGPGGVAGAAGLAALAALPIRAAAIGAVVWGLIVLVTMGACSWWLIGLQRYKNVVTGPWDPARPIIRAGAWD